MIYMVLFPKVGFHNSEKNIFSDFTGFQILILVIFYHFSEYLEKIYIFYLNEGFYLYITPLGPKIGVSDLYRCVSNR